MTDRELVLELCKRLGMRHEPTQNVRGICGPGEDEYTEHPDDPQVLLMGTGSRGMSWSYHAFIFDVDGKLTGHYIDQ